MIYNKAVGPCAGLVGKLFGHKFQERRSKEDRDFGEGEKGSRDWTTYDICTRCGATVWGGYTKELEGEDWGDDEDEDDDDGDMDDGGLPIPSGDFLRVNDG